MKRLHLLTALAVAALFVAACGGGATPAVGAGAIGTTTTQAGGGETVEMVATEFTFEPANVNVPAGSTMELILDNQGVVEHDFTLEEADVTIHANPSKATAGTFSIEAGTYIFYCSIPGHREAGMEGTLIAE